MGFLNELCKLAMSLQSAARPEFFDNLCQRGVVNIIKLALVGASISALLFCFENKSKKTAAIRLIFGH